MVSPKKLEFNAGNSGIVFGQFGNVCEMDFVPRTEVHGFCCVFGDWGCFGSS